MNFLHKILYVTSSPYGKGDGRYLEEKGILDKYLAKGWLVKDIRVVTLESGGTGQQSYYQTIYHLDAPDKLVGKLSAEEYKNAGLSE